MPFHLIFIRKVDEYALQLENSLKPASCLAILQQAKKTQT